MTDLRNSACRTASRSSVRVDSQGQLAEVVLADGPMRLRGVLEIEGPSQLDMERTSCDPRIEPLEDLAARDAIVGPHLDALRALGLGFDAVRMGHATAFPHASERLLKRLAAGEDERGVEAFRSEGTDGSRRRSSDSHRRGASACPPAR